MRITGQEGVPAQRIDLIVKGRRGLATSLATPFILVGAAER